MSLLLPLRTLHTGARFAVTRTPLSRIRTPPARIPQRAGPLSPPLILTLCKSTLQSKPAPHKPSARSFSNRPSSKSPKDLQKSKHVAKLRKENVEPKSEPDSEPDLWLLHLLSHILHLHNLIPLVGMYVIAVVLDYYCFGISDTLIEAILGNFVLLLIAAKPAVRRH